MILRDRPITNCCLAARAKADHCFGIMRSWIARHRFVLAALFGPVIILTPAIPLATAQSERENAALDALFDQLRLAPDQAAAQAITSQIWTYWITPRDPILAARMQDVLSLRQRADFPGVIALLDEIVVDYPTYAEAWNQRATVYYLLRNYDQSLADIEKVLEFEPRHFGALVGRAVIYKNQGKDDLARADMIAALAIHPYLVERALFPELEDIKFI
jgi:tetratricopeptide (TPR) repeat protein